MTVDREIINFLPQANKEKKERQYNGTNRLIKSRQ